MNKCLHFRFFFVDDKPGGFSRVKSSIDASLLMTAVGTERLQRKMRRRELQLENKHIFSTLCKILNFVRGIYRGISSF